MHNDTDNPSVPAASDAASAVAKPSGRRQFLIMLAMVLGTLAASYGLFYATLGGDVWNTTNAGEFVTPVQTVEALDLKLANGAPFSVEAEGLWWLLVAAPGGCSADCRLSTEQMRALHVLITKDATRVRRALLAPAGSVLDEAFPKLERLRGTGLAEGVYLVDPAGVLVLRYPLGDSGALVQKDLKKLLKISRLG